METLPRQDGLARKVLSIKESDDLKRVSVQCSSELISAVDEYKHWLLGFQEHYNQLRGVNAEYKSYKVVMIHGMHIPSEMPTLTFEIDTSKYLMNFYMKTADADSRKIVYNFIRCVLLSD